MLLHRLRSGQDCREHQRTDSRLENRVTDSRPACCHWPCWPVRSRATDGQSDRGSRMPSRNQSRSVAAPSSFPAATTEGLAITALLVSAKSLSEGSFLRSRIVEYSRDLLNCTPVARHSSFICLHVGMFHIRTDADLRAIFRPIVLDAAAGLQLLPNIPCKTHVDIKDRIPSRRCHRTPIAYVGVDSQLSLGRTSNKG